MHENINRNIRFCFAVFLFSRYLPFFLSFHFSSFSFSVCFVQSIQNHPNILHFTCNCCRHCNDNFISCFVQTWNSSWITQRTKLKRCSCSFTLSLRCHPQYHWLLLYFIMLYSTKIFPKYGNTLNSMVI